MAKEKIPTKDQLKSYLNELNDYIKGLKEYIASYVGTTPPGPKPKNPPNVPKG